MHMMSQTEGRPRSAEAKEDHSLVHAVRTRTKRRSTRAPCIYRIYP